MRKPLYRKSFRHASAEGEVEQWRASALENKRCRDGIDDMIKDRFDGGFLRGECAKELCEEYGADRGAWVLAGNVLTTDDGRYRPSTKEWARSVKIPDEPYDRSGLYLLKSHPEVINGLIDEYRAYIAQTPLHGLDDIVKDSFEENYENRLLILKPEALSEDYRDGDYQYFVANSGFGCDPQKIGRKVFGRFLIDDEHAQFRRENFYGIADEEKLPAWAIAKLKETMEKPQTEGIGDIK